MQIFLEFELQIQGSTETIRQREIHSTVLAFVYLTEQADGEAVEPTAGEERQPVLRPAPSGVVAPVHEHQRRIEVPTALVGAFLRDDLHGQAGGELVEEAVLPRPQLVPDRHLRRSGSGGDGAWFAARSGAGRSARRERMSAERERSSH